jgi:hypothetical protein
MLHPFPSSKHNGKNTRKHTKCPLVKKGDFAAVTNRQYMTKVIDRDTVDGTIKRVRPNTVFRTILFGG